MIRLSSPHVHTQFCDGRSSAEEMVQTALDKGFVSLGFTSHAKQDFDHFYSMDEEREALYIQEIHRLQAKYGDRLRIWLGTERDALSFADRADFDYVIGSVHYLDCKDGSRLPVDATPQMVTEGIALHFGGDGIAFAKAYYQRLGAYIRSYQPDIIGHFDLIMKNNQKGQLFDPDSPDYLRVAKEAMEEAITGCKLLEVNTGAIARFGVLEPYPRIKLLAYWRSLGGQVILSSDCHNAKDLDAGYDQGVAAILAAGYKKAAFLGRHQDLFEWETWA